VLTCLGYGAEPATWRNIFLTGAQPLRESPRPFPVDAGAIAGVHRHPLFDSIAIPIDGRRVSWTDVMWWASGGCGRE